MKQKFLSYIVWLDSRAFFIITFILLLCNLRHWSYRICHKYFQHIWLCLHCNKNFKTLRLTVYNSLYSEQDNKIQMKTKTVLKMWSNEWIKINNFCMNKTFTRINYCSNVIQISYVCLDDVCSILICSYSWLTFIWIRMRISVRMHFHYFIFVFHIQLGVYICLLYMPGLIYLYYIGAFEIDMNVLYVIVMLVMRKSFR